MGEIGGFVSPAAEPAYYAKVIESATLAKPLSASGTLNVSPGRTHTLVGFFNVDTINEWRTPNSIVLRVDGRGQDFHVYAGYATQRWRTGEDCFAAPQSPQGKRAILSMTSGEAVHTWSLKYDPLGNKGGGTITANFDGQKLDVNLEPEHKADGAIFNRFGLINVMKAADQGSSLWIDDVTINGDV